MENHYQNDNVLTFDKINKEIDKILKNSNHIEFNGGEPTLNKNLFKILDYTNSIKKNIEIGLISNARLFSYKNFLEQLLKLKLNNFKVITTIYGHNTPLHDSITRTPHSFVQQINGIRNLIRKGIKIELRIVINKINYKYLPEISNYLINNFSSKDFIYINFINTKLTGQALKNVKIIGIQTNKIIPFLDKSVIKLNKHQFNIKLSHFPHCILPPNLW